MYVESSQIVMAHGDAQEGKWRGNWRMEWVASTFHTTSEHGVSSITTITISNAHTSAASSRLNWRPRLFKWTRPFRRKMRSGFCVCAITFQLASINRCDITKLRSVPHRVLVCLEWLSQSTPIASLNSIKQFLVTVQRKNGCVLCEVRTESLCV